CRTGHDYIGEYYSKFVPSKNVDCPCGEQLQTQEHILRVYPRYERDRYLLRKVSDTVNLADILGSEEGIEALISFIEKSGAFTRDGSPRKEKSEPEY
ncbi:hypothetical protein GYMLUDRAFT_122374, partial [Collybiopsis luxurians FD-317 M1]